MLILLFFLNSQLALATGNDDCVTAVLAGARQRLAARPEEAARPRIAEPEHPVVVEPAAHPEAHGSPVETARDPNATLDDPHLDVPFSEGPAVTTEAPPHYGNPRRAPLRPDLDSNALHADPLIANPPVRPVPLPGGGVEIPGGRLLVRRTSAARSPSPMEGLSTITLPTVRAIPNDAVRAQVRASLAGPPISSGGMRDVFALHGAENDYVIKFYRDSGAFRNPSDALAHRAASIQREVGLGDYLESMGRRESGRSAYVSTPADFAALPARVRQMLEGRGIRTVEELAARGVRIRNPSFRVAKIVDTAEEFLRLPQTVRDNLASAGVRSVDDLLSRGIIIQERVQGRPVGAVINETAWRPENADFFSSLDSLVSRVDQVDLSIAQGFYHRSDLTLGHRVRAEAGPANDGVRYRGIDTGSDYRTSSHPDRSYSNILQTPEGELVFIDW